MKTFVLGDLHGGYKALLQVLERASFDYSKDKLISLGDIADGWPDVVECFEELLKIKNMVMIVGNHDQWLINWMKFDESPLIWVSQGGANTLASYAKHTEEIKIKHFELLLSCPVFYVDKKNRLFVHGGLIPGVPIEEQSPQFLMWDRGLVESNANVPEYKEVYIGHTSIWDRNDKPVQYGNIICMDTGGGWEGKLSLMNINTKEVFQSDVVQDLYPDTHHR